MAKNKDVLLLMPLMAEIGILICFYSIVLPTCVGTTPDLPDSKSLMGLAVLMVGVGELLATFVQVLHSKHFIQVRPFFPLFSHLKLQLGSAFCLLIYSLITFYLTFPDTCTLHATTTPGIISPQKYAILISALAIGYFDCTTQVAMNRAIG